MGTTNFVNLLDQISVSLRIKWREMRHEGFTSRPLLVAFPRISGLGMAFLAGWTADRFGARRTMGGVLLLTGIMTALLSVT
jgi:MFS family permease